MQNWNRLPAFCDHLVNRPFDCLVLCTLWLLLALKTKLVLWWYVSRGATLPLRAFNFSDASFPECIFSWHEILINRTISSGCSNIYFQTKWSKFLLLCVLSCFWLFVNLFLFWAFCIHHSFEGDYKVSGSGCEMYIISRVTTHQNTHITEKSHPEAPGAIEAGSSDKRVAASFAKRARAPFTTPDGWKERSRRLEAGAGASRRLEASGRSQCYSEQRRANHST